MKSSDLRCTESITERVGGLELLTKKSKNFCEYGSVSAEVQV